MTERIVGIDFGTSTSVIRVKRYEDGVPVGDANLVLPVTFNMGSTVVPTLIKETSSGKSYGYDAQIPKRNSTTYQNFKVDLESTDEEKKEEARKLTRDFFTYLAKVYNEQSNGGYLGDNTDKVRTLISYPVKWSDETKKFMLETAKEAGFANVEGMDEAQAAISAVLVQNADHFEKYGYLEGAQSVNVMLIDMGAGTTDLVLCKYYIKEKKTEIICTWPKEGNILFGGKEVDEILRAYISSKLPEEENEAILRRCGLEKFKAWKENFISPALRKGDRVEEFSDLDMIVDMIEAEVEDYSIDRSVFEQQAAEYLKKFTTLINGCIEESKTDSNDVDLVILTGGHSQWYFVSDIISGKTKAFGEVNLKKIVDDNNRIIPIVRPQETVAMGLVFSELKQNAVVTPEPKPHVAPVTPKVSETPEIPVEPETPIVPVAQRTEMAIINVFDLDGANRIATNNIVPENTEIHVGDIVDFYRNGNKFFSSVIRGICVGRENTTSAKSGDDVGILFENVTVKIDKKDIMVIAEKSANDPKKVAIATNRTPLTGGTVSGAGVYEINSKVTLTAAPSQGYKFNRWNDGNINASREIIVRRDKTYVALFDKINDIDPSTITINNYNELNNVTYDEHEVASPDEFELDSINGCYSIRKYIGNRSHVIIPEEIRGRKVVAIGKNAFGSVSSMLVNPAAMAGAVTANRNLVSVEIPDSVTIIEAQAFLNCRSLERVKMSRNIEIIKNNAFSNCRSLKSIEIGERLKVLSLNVFCYCKNLESVRLPATIETIEGSAFAGCNNLMYLNFGAEDNKAGFVTFPRGMKKIGPNAFSKINYITMFPGDCVFKEVLISKKTKVKEMILNPATFKNCALFYYEG